MNKFEVPKKREISVMKFSPDSKLLALGVTPMDLYIYSMSQSKIIHTIGGNSARITHMDFSTNSQVLQTNSNSYEILYYDCDKGKQLTSGASQNKDEPWASWTCTIGIKEKNQQYY